MAPRPRQLTPHPLSPLRRRVPPGRMARFYARHERPILMLLSATFALLAMIAWTQSRHAPRALTQKDIDAAVLHTLENSTMPSMAAKAYEAIRGSVVRVNGVARDPEDTDKSVRGVGTGVVIVDKGIILTNLHVVLGAEQIKVRFFDGMEAEATVIGVRPEHDLAVLQAKTVPDDLVGGHAALDRRSRGRRPGGRGRLSVRHRPVGVGRRRVGPEARIPLAGRQAHPDQPHPVRRRGQSRQLRRPARHRRRRSRGHRHRHPQSDRASACSSASASRCRSRTPRRRSACRRSNAHTRIQRTGTHGTIRDTDSAEVATLMERILYEVKKVVVGQDHFLERVLVAILAQGHLLVEGVPGLAKTLTVKTLARTVRGTFKRIQFTPDLVPADLVGTRIYNQKTGDFATSLGPVFTHLLLADEINRAPAKVQSALLEVMQEYQVTIAGETHFGAAAVPRDGDAEPDRDRRHVSAARGAGRPLHDEGAGRLSERGRGVRHRPARDRRAGRRVARWPPPSSWPRCSANAAASTSIPTLISTRCGWSPPRASPTSSASRTSRTTSRSARARARRST